MKKRIGRILSWALTAVLFGSMLSPAFAAENDYCGAVTGWWDSVLYQLTQNHSPYWWGDAVQSISGLLCQDVCGSSPDGVHHASSVSGGEMVDDTAGSFTYATCTYCHERFKVYASDLQQSYDAQVAELPAMGYQSDGSLLWSPQYSYLYAGNGAGLIFLPFVPDGETQSTPEIVKFSPSFDASTLTFSARPITGRNDFFISSVRFSFVDVYPLDGYYILTDSPCSSFSYIGKDSITKIHTRSYSGESSSVLYYAGVKYSKEFEVYNSFDDVKYLSLQVFPPVYKITPFNPSGSTNTTYNINSRPTSITGDYGIIGDNGQIIKVEGDKIVNETNNTYYNPSTGQTVPITDWSYNYEDRSYTVTTESGDTVTITYGDENVVIKEGDTTYNIYYLVDGSGSETPDPGPDVPGTCNHQWAETSTTPATCTVPGSRLLTCSLCNETKTETIPAPGHKWTIKQEVKNEYDSSGNQTQEGYTIWECSVCGEQQKTTDGTAPPGGGGSGSGSSGGVFSGIFGLLVDFLGFFWNTFRDFVGEGVKGFLTALMDGTSSIFGLLNPFSWGG